jgi:rod shape-determining protein MreD
MTAQVAKGAVLVFFAAIVQASVFNRVTVFHGTLDILLVTVVAAGFVGGSVYGAVAGFAAGLLIDTAALETLGVTSLLLTVIGYWSGRYGETTGRGKGHAPLLSVAVAVVAFGIGGLALLAVLGEQEDALGVLRSLPASVVLDVVFMAAAYPLVRRLLARGDGNEVPEVRLLG